MLGNPALLGRPLNSEEAGPGVPMTWGLEGTAADRLTFGDGILLVHRPQQLQGKDRRPISASRTGQDKQAAAHPQPEDRRGHLRA